MFCALVSIVRHLLIMDWNLCIICQKEVKNENLCCPANSKRKGVGVGYSSFVCALEEFRKLESLPVSIDVSLLDDGSGIEDTLSRNKAKWHKNCRLLFGNLQLDRAKKRKSSEVELLI